MTTMKARAQRGLLFPGRVVAEKHVEAFHALPLASEASLSPTERPVHREDREPHEVAMRAEGHLSSSSSSSASEESDDEGIDPSQLSIKERIRWLQKLERRNTARRADAERLQSLRAQVVQNNRRWLEERVHHSTKD